MSGATTAASRSLRHHQLVAPCDSPEVLKRPKGRGKKQFLGRCANFINGELYGRPATVPWAVQFPHELLNRPDLAAQAVEACEKIDPTLATPGVIVHAAISSEPVREVLAGILTPRHPSQLYAAFLEGLLIFIVLWLLRTRVRVPAGIVTGTFFLLYAAGRIFGELFREPDAGIAFTLGLTRGQFLSVFMILIGLAFMAASIVRNRCKNRPA